MSDASTIALGYERLGERPQVVPLGMTILLSIALPGLPSVLLRSWAAIIRELLLIYAVAASGAGVIALVWQLFLGGEDWTGLWLFLALYLLLASATLRLSLRDRQDAAAKRRAPVEPSSVWLSLFWISFVASRQQQVQGRDLDRIDCMNESTAMLLPHRKMALHSGQS